MELNEPLPQYFRDVTCGKALCASPIVWRRCVMLVGGWRRRRENPGAHGQAQVPCFLNSRGDLGSANAALRLWQQRFCSCFRNGKWGLLAPRCWLRCAAIRPGRARGGNFGF